MIEYDDVNSFYSYESGEHEIVIDVDKNGGYSTSVYKKTKLDCLKKPYQTLAGAVKRANTLFEQYELKIILHVIPYKTLFAVIRPRKDIEIISTHITQAKAVNSVDKKLNEVIIIEKYVR